MDDDTFDRFRVLVYRHAGIALSSAKKPLVTARVQKRMRVLGIPEYRDYLRYVLSDESGAEIVHLLDVISTNVTGFFREADHFALLRSSIAGWLGAGQHRFRFWSAACSSGEEAYSLAMTFQAVAGPRSCDVRILATDVSTRALETARAGVYRADRLEAVPREYRERWLVPVSGSGAGPPLVRVAHELSELVYFRRLNLSVTPYPMNGPFDAIFCRNVMIYFDNPVRLRLLNEVRRLLRPGGLLFVGHAESLTGMLSNLQPVRPAVYRKP